MRLDRTSISPPPPARRALRALGALSVATLLISSDAGARGGFAVARVSGPPAFVQGLPGTSAGLTSLNGTFKPAMPPPIPMDPNLYGFGNPGATMPSWGIWAPACTAGVNGLMGMSGNNLAASAGASSSLAEGVADSVPPYYPKGVDEDRGRRYGDSINKLFSNGEHGCEKFVTKDGKIGPWGNYALEQIKDPKHHGTFDTKVPDDIKQYCPNFAAIQADPARMQYFWLYLMAALAKPESTCSAGAINHTAPHGDAIGLYQLEPRACNGMSEQELMDPYKNIHCAVDVLGHEMQCRDTLKTTTSKGGHNRCGTYWGELRRDPFGAGDTAAAGRFNGMISQWQDCKMDEAKLRLPATQTK